MRAEINIPFFVFFSALLSESYSDIYADRDPGMFVIATDRERRYQLSQMTLGENKSSLFLK